MKDSKSRSNKKSKRSLKANLKNAHLNKVNLFAAGIDIGSKSHFVAIPEGIDKQTVREFSSFTKDLYLLASWLQKNHITTVAMESTGVYWIPLYDVLSELDFEVLLVDAKKVKNVSGRKTDVLDCQWLQQLHTYGLLQGAFRPDTQICTLRSYMRQRQMLIEQTSKQVQHMQKALNQMNLQLHNVISDITGVTGIKIIRDISAGIRDPKLLSQYRDPRCKRPIEDIEASLNGHYREEHVFSLKQALELYDFYHKRIEDCDCKIESFLKNFEGKKIATDAIDKKTIKKGRKYKTTPKFDINTYMKSITGVDLAAIPGIDGYSALKIIAEIGCDMSKWRNAKSFASWLGLTPNNRISGGKKLSSKKMKIANKAASYLRFAANSLTYNDSALGAFLRRQKARLGAPKAITATARKIAVIIYEMISSEKEYIEIGQAEYEAQYRQRKLLRLMQTAKEFGLTLTDDNDQSMTYAEVT